MSQASDLDLQAGFAGSTLICSRTPATATIRVPPPRAAQAKVTARLVTLLRDSLYDDAKGIVNIAREKEIKKLANKLSRESDQGSRFHLPSLEGTRGLRFRGKLHCHKWHRSTISRICSIVLLVHKKGIAAASRPIQVPAYKLYGATFNDYPIRILEELRPMQLALDPNASRSSKGRSRTRSQQ